MNAPDQWTDQFLTSMQDVCDEPADSCVSAMFDSGEIWQFVTNLKAAAAGNQYGELPAPAAAFMDTQAALPDWVQPALLDEGARVFASYGPLTIASLFTASLPECYAITAEAGILHRTGQLETHTDWRIHQTARLIFHVMLEGGFSSGKAVRVALMVRLIHAVIRHLIANAPTVPADHPHAAWAAQLATTARPDKGRAAINQLQLAYTLLSFGYVIVRSLRRMGIRWDTSQEHAYLHTWNVTGHLLGVDNRLMADNMQDAEVLFDKLKHAMGGPSEAGRALTRSLLVALEAPMLIGKALPALLTRQMIGDRTARELAVGHHHGLLRRTIGYGLLALLRALAWLANALGRNVPGLEYLIRHAGQGWIEHLLETQTRAFFVPMHLREQWDARTGSLGRVLFRRGQGVEAVDRRS